jgi:hypothetical protein
MKTFQMDFKFIMAPVGAGKNATTSRDRDSIYKKTSVNTINNKDNNCLFRALTIPMHSTHAKIDDIKKAEKYMVNWLKSYALMYVVWNGISRYPLI